MTYHIHQNITDATEESKEVGKDGVQRLAAEEQSAISSLSGASDMTSLISAGQSNTHLDALQTRMVISDESDCYLADISRSRKPKLNSYTIPISGRSREISLLTQCYQRVTTPVDRGSSNRSEIILISGVSGTGKSKLAGLLREPVSMQRNGFFVSGKFDHARKDPYVGLIEAFTDLCDLVAQQDERGCDSLAKILKEELVVLKTVIPNLSRITAAVQSDESDDVSQKSGKDCFTQLKLACRKFINAIASEKHPVVLLLDDLQWADECSMDVIRSLVTDKESKYVTIIGTHRNRNNKLGNNRVENLIQALKESKEECLRCTFIKLENFGLGQVIALVSDATKIDPSKTVDLAELILKRTSGLPFFVVKFMEMLQDRQLLSYSHKNGEWVYSVSQIQTETDASDNVVEIVAGRIQQLELPVQSVLKLAALQGFQFDWAVVTALARTSNELNSYLNITDVVNESLRVAEDEGLVETSHDGVMRFCHDRIHECIYSMIPSGKKLAELHLSISYVLKGRDDNQKFVFSIADHLNRGSEMLFSKEAKLDSALCNLRAAKLAMKKSAFVAAADYAHHGLAQISDSVKWSDTYYSTVLGLYCTAADACYSFGDIEGCDRNLDEIFENARSAADKIRAYSIRISSLSAQARLDETIDVAFFAARQLGLKIPKKPNMRNALWACMKTKVMMHSKTDQQLLAPPNPCADVPGMYQAVEVLRVAAQNATLVMKKPHVCLAIATMMQISMKGQASKPSIFASYGVLETALGNIPEAIRMGEVALRLQELRHNQPEDVPATLALTHTFLAHWRTHLRHSLQPLVRAHRLGMESGNFSDAFLALQAYLPMAFFCGCQLVDLEQQMRHYCTIMLEFDHKNMANISLPYWQLCINLLGQNYAPTKLTGEAMDQASLDQEYRVAKSSIALMTIRMVRIVLCYHFDDVASLKSLLDNFEGSSVGHFMLYIGHFYLGLANIALYRSAKKRNYKGLARKSIKKMRKWTKDGCINTKPLLALMDAEMATLTQQKHTEKVRTAFDQAIDEARASENAYLEAMANERAARYFQFQTVDQMITTAYMDEALLLYDSWGAASKIDYLETSCPWLAVQPGAAPHEIVTNGS